jgi:hypothetical protein
MEESDAENLHVGIWEGATGQLAVLPRWPLHHTIRVRKMADVFISYAREDEPRIRDLVQALDEQRWSIFWDRRIPAGQTWRSYIGQALTDARCVVVAWSRHSLASHFVAEEADEGIQRGILVPVLIEPVTPPLGFRSIHAADLTDWQINRQSLQFDQLVKDIDAVLHSPSVSQKDAVEVRGVSLANRRDVQTPIPIRRSSRTLAYAVLVTVIITGVSYMAVREWLFTSTPEPKSPSAPVVEANPPAIPVQPALISPPGESRKPAASGVVPQSGPEPERAEKAEPRKIRPSDGEAACYDEAAFQLLVASLQKIKDRYARNLINFVEHDQHRQKLVNDFDHLVARGPSTESCILQQLGLVKSLYDDQLINTVQRDASREILYTKLHNLCMPKATDTTPIADCLNLMNVAYDQQLINTVQRDASRQRLWKTVHDLLLARAQTEIGIAHV